MTHRLSRAITFVPARILGLLFRQPFFQFGGSHINELIELPTSDQGQPSHVEGVAHLMTVSLSFTILVVVVEKSKAEFFCRTVPMKFEYVNGSVCARDGQRP